jgi:hypothetical protein
MKVGDLVKHNGQDGWHKMEGKIGVLKELLKMPDPRCGRWIVHWCDPNTPRYYQWEAYFPEHLETLCK